MEVILRDHVENLGKRGEIVKVADGYARNYLLPRKLALPATDANKKWVERERKIAEARDHEERAGRRGHCRAVERARCHHHAQDGRKRPAVWLGHQRRHRRTAGRQGLRDRPRKILLPDPIKSLGENTVPVKLHRDVTAQLKVTVAKEDVDRALSN